MAGCPVQTQSTRHARHPAASCPHRFPAHPPPPARHAAGEPGLPVQPELPALPCECRPESHRDDGRRHRGAGAAGAACAAHRYARSDRRRARAQPQLPRAGARRTRIGRAHHRPLQSDHPVRAGAGRPGRIPGRAGRGGDRVAALLFAGQCRPAARRRRVRAQHRRAAAAQCAGVRPAGVGPGAEPGLQPAGCGAAAAAGAAGRRLPARAGTALRHPLQPPVRADQHADPALRQHPRQQGHVRRLHATAARRLPGREPGHADVPQHRQRRLAGRPVRLRFQPDAGPARAAGRRGAPAPARAAAARPRRGRHPRGRPLLRLHRRPGQQLRRRARRRGGPSLVVPVLQQAAGSAAT